MTRIALAALLLYTITAPRLSFPATVDGFGQTRLSIDERTECPDSAKRRGWSPFALPSPTTHRAPRRDAIAFQEPCCGVVERVGECGVPHVGEACPDAKLHCSGLLISASRACPGTARMCTVVVVLFFPWLGAPMRYVRIGIGRLGRDACRYRLPNEVTRSRFPAVSCHMLDGQTGPLGLAMTVEARDDENLGKRVPIASYAQRRFARPLLGDLDEEENLESSPPPFPRRDDPSAVGSASSGLTSLRPAVDGAAETGVQNYRQLPLSGVRPGSWFGKWTGWQEVACLIRACRRILIPPCAQLSIIPSR